MSIIEQSVGILYTVTVALKAPVVFGILLALVWVLLECGGFLREWYERRRCSSRWQVLLSALSESQTVDAVAFSELFNSDSVPELFARFLPDFRKASKHRISYRLSKLMQSAEFEAARRLSRIRLGLRLGPVLGLMGTLIPMGPALMNVSQGNLAMMSNDLIIAFGTTVAGLFIGALCYVMLIARQYWYSKDIADIENLTGMAENCEKQ